MGRESREQTETKIERERQAVARRLESVSLERRERYHVVEKRKFNPNALYPEPWFGMNYAHTLDISRLRFLNVPRAVRLNETLESPATVARDYLKLVYGHGPGLRGPARAVIPDILKNRKPSKPLYASPCKFREGYYVDIYHCYWSIMLAIGWNVAYLPAKYLLAGRAPLDFPFPEHSTARDCLVSCAMHSEIIKMFPPRPEKRPVGKFNPVLNETITVLINDVLHSIAWQARALGAVYWHTDGCIAPNRKAAERIEQMVLDWGLEVTFKSIGPGAVWGVGSYRVGDMVTVRTDREQGYNGLLELDYAKWLQVRFAALAARGNA